MGGADTSEWALGWVGCWGGWADRVLGWVGLTAVSGCWVGGADTSEWVLGSVGLTPVSGCWSRWG